MRTDTRRPIEIGALAVTLVMAAVVFAATRPAASDPATPLPWDMSEHYLRSLRIAGSILHGDIVGFLVNLREWSVYPPLNYLLRGIWLAAFGESPAGLSLFHFLTLAGALSGLWWGFRRTASAGWLTGFAIAAATLLASRDFLAHVHTVMLDSHAAGLAVLALGSMPSLASTPSRRNAGITVLLVSATLLTKYNVGLPLLVSLGVLWAISIRRHGKQALWILGAALASAAVWALFLTVQDHGWASFREFSENRATEGDWNAFTRAAWYGKLYVTQNTIHPALSIAALGLTVAGCARWRSPFFAAGAAYVLSSFFAMANHEYLLSRLLVAPAAALAILAGTGATVIARSLRSLAGRVAVAGAVLVAVAVLAIGPTRDHVAEILPADRALLDPVTRSVEDAFANDAPDLVLGTFNNFSQPWIRLLWWRHAPGYPAPPLDVELFYPLEPAREGLDATDSPRYREVLDDYLASRPTASILTIEPVPGARWWDGDYSLWNQWKQNYITAARAHPRLVVRNDRTFEAAGVRVSLLQSIDEVIYGEGWDKPEPWGRWIAGPSARAIVQAEPGERELVIVSASHPAQGDEPQPCQVFANGELVGSFVVRTPPWQWTEFGVELPADGKGTWDLDIRCEQAWTAAPDDERLLRTPVKRMYVR